LTHLEQAFEVVALDLRAKRISQAAANLIQDFAGALGVDFIRNLDRVAEVGARRGAGAAQRITVGAARALALLAAFALLALHRLLHLVHHVLGATAQRLQGATLLASCTFALTFAECSFGFAHGFTGLAKAFSRFHSHAFQRIHEGLQLLAKIALAFLKLPQSFGELISRHALARLSLLASLPLLALLSFLPLA